MMNKLYIFISLTLFTQYAEAQASHTVNIHINEFTEIRAKPTKLEQTDFKFDDVSQIVSGITKWGVGSYQVRSNNEWVVSVRAKNAFFTNIGEGSSTDMPCSILKIKEGNSPNEFQTLATLPTPIKSGSSGDFGGQNEFNLDYQANPGIGYSAGIYTMNVVLTVSPN